MNLVNIFTAEEEVLLSDIIEQENIIIPPSEKALFTILENIKVNSDEAYKQIIIDLEDKIKSVSFEDVKNYLFLLIQNQ